MGEERERGTAVEQTLDDAAGSPWSNDEWTMPVDPLLILPTEFPDGSAAPMFVWPNGRVRDVT